MFFRNATDSASQRRPASRSASATEAQLKEMRNKARRRLIGALALVLAAVIIVPPLFDQAPPADLHEPIVVPAPPSGLTPAELPGQGLISGNITADEGAPARETAQSPNAGHAVQDHQATPPAPAAQAGTDTTATPPAIATEPVAPPKVEDKPPKAVATPPSEPKRTDDGAVALALLAGKIPDTPAQKPSTTSEQGSFVLQIAAYTTEQDANQRRDKLIESGVTNAYVERAQSGDKTVYRLRVGPFTSHEAAQASQTRLRALGYQNGLISSK